LLPPTPAPYWYSNRGVSIPSSQGSHPPPLRRCPRPVCRLGGRANRARAARCRETVGGLLAACLIPAHIWLPVPPFPFSRTMVAAWSVSGCCRSNAYRVTPGQAAADNRSGARPSLAAAGPFAVRIKVMFRPNVTCQKLRQRPSSASWTERAARQTLPAQLDQEGTVTEFDSFRLRLPEARSIFPSGDERTSPGRPHAAAATVACRHFIASCANRRAGRFLVRPVEIALTAGSRPSLAQPIVIVDHAFHIGYSISDTSLPPAGTILSAQIMLADLVEPRRAPTIRASCQADCRPVPACACCRHSPRRSGSIWWAEVPRPPRAREGKSLACRLGRARAI